MSTSCCFETQNILDWFSRRESPFHKKGPSFSLHPSPPMERERETSTVPPSSATSIGFAAPKLHLIPWKSGSHTLRCGYGWTARLQGQRLDCRTGEVRLRACDASAGPVRSVSGLVTHLQDR